MIGCLSPEERCVAVLSELNGRISSSLFYKIIDPQSRFSERSGQLISENESRIKSKRVPNNIILQCDLLVRYGKFVDDLNKFIDTSSGKIIIDISSLPKRFFFPVIRRCLQSDKITDLLVTYTIPAKYCEGPLAEDPDDVLPLPLFDDQGLDNSPTRFAFIGIGFLTLRLTELLKDYPDTSLRLFFPFPPGPPHFQRNLKILHEIMQTIQTPSPNIIRVNAYDTSDCFDYICQTTNNGQRKAIMAPFGPKPISLAMCIYATLTNSAVYYSQPRVYNPEYCIGIKRTVDIPEIHTYCLRINGVNFYDLN